MAVTCQAQYKGYHIPGFTGLQNGTQPAPGPYVRSLLWVYPTSTVTDNNGNSVTLPGSLTCVAPIFKVLGGNIGASIAFPFIQNRIPQISLNIDNEKSLREALEMRGPKELREPAVTTCCVRWVHAFCGPVGSVIFPTEQED